MKIFVVCTRLCFGGAEHVGVLLANGLANRGHEITVIANLFDEQTYELDANIRLLNLVSTNSNKIFKWLGAFFLMRKYLKQYRPDVVIGILNTTSFIAKIAGIGLHIPVVMTEHDSFERPKNAPFGFWKWFAKFELNKMYRYVTVLTEADKKNIKEKLNNVIVMPNPLSWEQYAGISKREKVILAAGRLEDWFCKGFDILLDAFAKIADKYPDWNLQIAGYGTLRELDFIRRMAREKNIEKRVCLLGFRNDIRDVFQKKEIFVLSSRYEGFGLVLIEAMSQGCACIACDFKGRQREIITSENEGLICKVNDIDALSAAMEKLISNPDYRKLISEGGKERSKVYSSSRISEKWEYLLKSIVDENNRIYGHEIY